MNRKGTVLLFLLISTVAKSEEEVWWLRETYRPTDTTIESLPISMISKDWSKASLLSESKLSIEAKKYLAWIRRQTDFGEVRYSKFRIEGDFNNDGWKDLAVVGTYQDKASGYGRFLLILAQTKSGWKKAHLETTSGLPGFSVMHLSDGSIVWTDCFECDVGVVLEWKTNHYELVSPSDDED